MLGFRGVEFAQIDLGELRQGFQSRRLQARQLRRAIRQHEAHAAVAQAACQFFQKEHAAQAAAENGLTQALRSLFAVVENYPDLKANQNVMSLQEELTATENKIAFSRQFYNDVVMDYNNSTSMFPSSIFAGMFGFKQAEFYNVPEAEREAPKVKF